MRTDPSDTGGLFVGRRPGTAPLRFRKLPERGSEARQRVDGSLAGVLFGSLAILRRLDQAWILVRRAAGHDQRTGALGRIFAATAAVCALLFIFWFLIIHGPGTN